MKFLTLEQGTEAWLQYRKERVTATDIAALMGLNPYCTAYQLWQRKLGLLPETHLTERMVRGRDLEPVALERYIELTGVPMMPACVESSERPYVMASLDGISPDLDKGVEIKCPGTDSHAKAMLGHIPDIYMPQLQCQMYVTGLSTWDYYSFDGDNGVCITVPRDDAFIEQMLPAIDIFHGCVLSRTAPALSERDCVQKDDIAWQIAADEWKQAKEQLNMAERRESEARDHLISLSEGRSAEGCGIRLRNIVQKGKIDYASIPEIMTLDLEKFRKPPIVKWTITSLK